MNIHNIEEPDPGAPLLNMTGASYIARSAVQQAGRLWSDVRAGIRRHAAHDDVLPRVLAKSRSLLWSETDAVDPRLQMARVQNLRCAVRQLNGVRVPAGATFSFWKQVGRPARRRGFAAGLTFHEDRLVATTGGGLWQFADTLYDAALGTDLQVLERWPHLHAIPDFTGVRGRDAFVQWNHIDLRFRARFQWQIEAELTASELIIRLRAAEFSSGAPAVKQVAIPEAAPDSQPAKAGPERPLAGGPLPALSGLGRTFTVVDEYWPEFQTWMDGRHDPRDGLAMPLDGETWNRPRYKWNTRRFRETITATRPALQRDRRLRHLPAGGPLRLQAELEANEAVALALGKRLPPDALHLVVMQPFLPWLWKNGFLGGRSFDVLMTRMPLAKLHDILDEAHRQHPERETLADFRAPLHIVEAELAALAAARRIITPHAAIAALFPEQAVKIPWQLTARRALRRPERFTIGFPGPAAARKGCYELRHAARALKAEVVLYGSELEGIGFWAGIDTRPPVPGGNRLEEVSVVVQPAFVENRPRSLLTALASGVPVIATPACGLDPHPNLILVPPGDEAALLQALSALRDIMTGHGAAPLTEDIPRQT